MAVNYCGGYILLWRDGRSVACMAVNYCGWLHTAVERWQVSCLYGCELLRVATYCCGEMAGQLLVWL